MLIRDHKTVSPTQRTLIWRCSSKPLLVTSLSWTEGWLGWGKERSTVSICVGGGRIPFLVQAISYIHTYSILYIYIHTVYCTYTYIQYTVHIHTYSILYTYIRTVYCTHTYIQYTVHIHTYCTYVCGTLEDSIGGIRTHRWFPHVPESWFLCFC